jgi:hypothetical protein
MNRYCILPREIIKQAATKHKKQCNPQPKQIKFRNVDMAGGKFVRVAFTDQLSQAG